MAYYNDQDEEQAPAAADPNAAAQPGGESGTISGQGSAGSAPGAASAAGAAANPSASATPGASQFVGISDYLNANKPQSAKLASQVSGYVSGLGDQARTAVNSGQQGFNQAVDQNTVGLDQNLLEQAKSDPNQVASDQAKLSEFKKERDASYKGPSSFDTSSFYQPTNQAVTKATTAAGNTGTEQGQKDLLSQLQSSKKGTVNKGALAFDSALLQADPNAKTTLAATRTNLADLPGKLTAAQQAALDKVAQANATTDATKASVQGAFTGQNGVQTLLQNQLQQKASDAIGQSKAQAEQTDQLLKSGATPNDDQLGLLGINRDQWNQLTGDRSYLQETYGVNPYSDLSTYATVKDPSTQINAQNIASADDYARYGALNQLMDTQNTFLSDPTKAGTANLDSLDFNYGGASGDIKNSIALEKSQAAQRAADAKAAADRAAAAQTASQQQAKVSAAAIGAAVAGPFGGIIGAIFCFVENTPILMESGHFKMVQELKIGDRVAHGGMVMAHGQSLAWRLVSYRGQITSDQHAVFDGERFVRAANLRGGKLIEFGSTEAAVVYPVVTENHLLISNNGVVYTDLMEVDAPGVSDETKLELLNTLEYVEFAQNLEKELVSWTSSNSEQSITQH